MGPARRVTIEGRRPADVGAVWYCESGKSMTLGLEGLLTAAKSANLRHSEPVGPRTRILQLVERTLPLGPSGLTDLEKALALVRGKPFDGRPLPWAEPHTQEMITRIIDVAHTVATYRIPAGPHHDLSAARQAVATGLDADPTAELLYRDWMRLEAARGNRSGLHTAITRLQQVNRNLDCSPETETTQLINELLNGSGTAARIAGSAKG